MKISCFWQCFRRFRPANALFAAVLVATPFSGFVDVRGAAQEDAQPLTVPDDLTFDAISAASDQATSDAIGPLVDKLYDQEAQNEERLAAAAELRTSAAQLESQALRNRLLRRVDLIEAGIKATQVGSPESAAIVSRMVRAANAFEGPNLVTDAAVVRESYGQLRDGHPEAADVMRPVMMRHYFNHNLHISISEVMLSRLLADHRSETGGVADCILGAWVTGQQVTDTSVSANIRRSTTTARFDLTVHGQTNTNTQGRKGPAVIGTRGRHFFVISKPMYFDGSKFTGERSVIDVDANNTTVWARTKYEKIPIVGSIARNIALKEARSKKGQSEAIAAYKLAKRAVPEFEREADSRFDDANRQLDEDVLKGLRARDIAPESFSTRSSESHLAVSSRTMGTGRLGGTPQPFAPTPPKGLTLQVHETAANNALDGLQLAGRSIPESEIAAEIEKALSDIFQRDIKLGDGKPDEPSEEPTAVFQFSKTDPIRVRFEGNRMVLLLRTGVIEEGKDPIPEQSIDIPLGVSLADGQIQVTPPESAVDIAVGSVEPAPRLQQITRANQIRRLLNARLKTRQVDSTFDITLGDEKISLSVVSIGLEDGWLTTEVE